MLKTIQVAQFSTLCSLNPVKITHLFFLCRWIPGTVISKSGPLSYTISENGQTHKQHIDQLKRVRKDDSDDLCDDFMQISRKVAASDQPPEEPDNGTSELEKANADLCDQAVETR